MENKNRHNDSPLSQNPGISGRQESSQTGDSIINKVSRQSQGKKPELILGETNTKETKYLPAHLTFLTLEGKWSPEVAEASGTGKLRSASVESDGLTHLLRVLAQAEAQSDSASAETNKNVPEEVGQFATDRAEEGILIINAGGRILYANDGAGKILGAPAAGLVDRVLVKTDITISGDENETKGEEGTAPVKCTVTGNLPSDGIVGIIKPDGMISWTKTQSHHLVENGRLTGSPTAILLKKITLDKNSGTLEKTMNDTLAKQLNQLERVNQELEDFNYSISHDLKSHIFVIEGYCSFIEGEYSEELNEDIIKCLHKIRARTLTMKNLLDALLRLSKITAGPLKREELCLSDIAHNILNDFHVLEPWRDTTLRVQPGLLEECDPNLVHTALYNLLDNAWKYTANNPLTLIDFGAEENGQQKIFYVRDNGIGLDMMDAENIFKPFTRLRSEPEYRGTGIGLVTVRKIIQRHEGTIWVESELGKGATFYFTLNHYDNQ